MKFYNQRDSGNVTLIMKEQGLTEEVDYSNTPSKSIDAIPTRLKSFPDAEYSKLYCPFTRRQALLVYAFTNSKQNLVLSR